MSLLRFVGALFLCIYVFLTSVTTVLESAVVKGEEPALKIRHISPSGVDVASGRQIVFQFNRPVVSVGRIQRRANEIPIFIEPALDCEWRWLNTSSLACQLSKETALTPATHYRIEVRPGIATADGATLRETYSHSFVTQRPRVSPYPRFHNWLTPGTPQIIVQFNQDVHRESVADHLYLQTDNDKRIPLVVMEDPEVTAARRRLKAGSSAKGERGKQVIGVIEEGKQRIKVSGRLPGDKTKISYARRNWLVYPKSELPLASNVELRVEPGIRSATGTEPGAEQRIVLGFDTFPEFRFLGVRCGTTTGERVVIAPVEDPSQKRCDPFSRTELLFSAPLTKETVQENVTVMPDLAGGRRDYNPWTNVYAYAGLSRPHRSDESYAVALPRGLKAYQSYTLAAEANAVRDVFGRPLIDNIAMTFYTDHRRPEFHLQHEQSVLEKDL